MPPLDKKTAPGEQESDDESSDIANSTEVDSEEDKDSSEGSSNEKEDEEEESEGNDDDGDSVSLSEESDHSTVYDSSDVWSDEEDEDKETKEAAEAKIMSDFHRSLELIVEGKPDKAKKILTKILKQPTVAKHKTTEFLWDNKATDHSHLNDMGKVFVAAHKNLAMLDEEKAIDHYLQVVGIAPCNDQVWFALGQKLVQKGDLDMAIYAFEQTNDWKAEEALMSTHFLKKNYKTALQYVAAREERMGSFSKGIFLKKRIASVSQELNEYVRQLFGKTSFVVDPKYENETSSRLSALQSKIAQCVNDSMLKEKNAKMARMAPIKICLSADQTAWDIMTVFCDLFDRIEAYSQVLIQRIFIEEWECRDDKLIVESMVEGMVDDVVAVENTVEHMMMEASMGVGQSNRLIRGRGKKGMEGMKKERSRRGQRDVGKEKEKEGMMRIEESSCDEEERPASVDSVVLREPSALEDVATYYLDARSIRPLREGMSQTPSRLTATPAAIGSEEEVLTLMRESLYHERYLTVFKALEVALYCTLTMDCLPSHSSYQSEILMQVYRRWTRCSSQLLQSHQLSIHAFMTMYDEPQAMDYCVRVVHSALEETDDEKVMKFSEKRDLIRFVNKRIENMIGNEEEMMKWLKFMVETIDEDEAFNVVGGVVSRDSVSEILEKKERAGRIQSLKRLGVEKRWSEIVGIVESDSQWSSVDDDEELRVRTRLYTTALIHVGRVEKAAEIINRMLFLLLSLPSLPVSTIGPWVKLLNAIKYSSIPAHSKMLPSLGNSLLRLTEHTHLAKDWTLWRVLHQVIKRIEESRPCQLIYELLQEAVVDKKIRPDDYDEMPTRHLRFLVHAHDRMAMIGVCGQEKGAFLKYSLRQFRSVMYCEDVRKTLKETPELQWLMSNVQAEIYQLLHCTFGRYSKKRRAAEDHGSGVELEEKETKKIMECAIALSVPILLPDLDDTKGRNENKGANADLIDLLNTKFSSFFEINHKRQEEVDELKKWMISEPVYVPPPPDWLKRGPEWKEQLKEEEGGENGEEMEETNEEKTRSPLLDWPHKGSDTELESKVFYLLALHYHRVSKTEDAPKHAQKYAEYFLSSIYVKEFGVAVAKTAWMMLSYPTIGRMFLLYDDDLLQEYEQHLRPINVIMELPRMTDPTVPFLLAQTLYQVATRLSRYFRKLPVWDPQQGKASIVEEIRRETTNQLEKVIDMESKQDKEKSTFDEVWLAYFYLAKLSLKGENPDVCKAVDSFFDAACQLQMSGINYQQKIPVKNQKGVEAVEIHYQAYSTVWKYITRTDNPPYEVLNRLRSYLDAFSKHGVVKPSAPLALYELKPEVWETVRDLSFKCSRSPKETDESFVLTNTLEKVELIEELKIACKDAFKLVTDRFPHRKAFHRLAEIALRDGDIHTAHSFIFKKIFPRKKKEDDIFNGVVEFSGSDIDRFDSLPFHVTRSLRLGLALSIKMGDAPSIVAVSNALFNTITNDEQLYVVQWSYLSMVQESTRALSIVLSSHPSQWTKGVKSEILTLHKSLVDAKDTVPLVCLRTELKKIVDSHGGLARLEGEVATNERRPTQQRKRKADGTGDGMVDRLGLSGRPPPPKMKPSSLAPHPPISLLSQLTQLSRPSQQLPTPQSAFTTSLLRTLHSSPLRPSSSSTSHVPSLSPISDPNRILQMLIQQAQSRSPNSDPNLFANLFKNN